MNPKTQTMVQRTVFFMLLLSGFAQMPIFKRYYIADIPGFGWLADFAVTHVMHYGFAIVFSFSVFDRLTRSVLEQRQGGEKPWLGDGAYAVLVGGILVSGVLLVARNFIGYRFSPGFITLLDIVHLGLVMVFLVFLSGRVIARRIRSWKR